MTAGDMEIINRLFNAIEDIARMDTVESIEFLVSISGQRYHLGYGESGEPAVLRIEDAS
jgi:hypothetical protein